MTPRNNKKEEGSRVVYEELESLIRQKAQGWIQEILEEEVNEFLGRQKFERLSGLDQPAGYRNGYGKPRKFSLMSGTVEIKRPRVRGLEDRFESKVLPLFSRHSVQMKEMIPELYLHGLSKGDFELALRGLLGDAAPLSISSIQRLKSKWQLEYEEWKNQDLSELEVVYFWADGIYVKAGIADQKAALLVIIGALSNGKKIVLVCESGQRESKESWLGILRDLKARGLKFPKLTIADGHLGIWSALGEIHPEGKEQRCWNHKIVNVIDTLPKKIEIEAKELLKMIPYQETRDLCEQKRDEFIRRYQKDYPKAGERLLRDWERMITFYDFPKEHWKHIRTTNVIESPFASIRIRTTAAKRYKKVENAKAMIWKLLQVAEKNFRTLNAPELMKEVYEGKQYKDGVKIKTEGQNKIAA